MKQHLALFAIRKRGLCPRFLLRPDDPAREARAGVARWLSLEIVGSRVNDDTAANDIRGARFQADVLDIVAYPDTSRLVLLGWRQ